MRSNRGFTTIELFIVIAIMAVLVALAIPSYSDFFDKNRVRGAAEMVYEHLMHAKTLAIKRSKPITVEFSVNGSDPWAMGYTDKTSCDPSGADCTISDYNNDGDTDDTEDNLAANFTDAKFKDVSVTQTFSDDNFSFDPIRGIVLDGANNAGEVVLKSASDRYWLQVAVSKEGFISICSPAGKKLVGYVDCP